MHPTDAGTERQRELLSRVQHLAALPASVTSDEECWGQGGGHLHSLES